MSIHQAKVIFSGDGAVGKTALVKRFTTGQYGAAELYKMTIGVNIDTYVGERDDTKFRLAIWDLGGQPHFETVRTSFYIGAHVVVFVYDITSSGSFRNLTNWLEEVNQACNAPYKGIIIGNKTDLSEFRAVAVDEAKSFAEANGFIYLETSAKDGEGVSELVEMLTDCVVMDVPRSLVKQIKVTS